MHHSLPLVSIGCAVYNGEELVDRALSALLAQDYPNFEIIVSDDGSTDRTPEICAEFARRDPRVRVLRNEKNIGVTRNFNRLFGETRGKYFMWADQDDLRRPTFVSKTVAMLEANPDAVLCHSHTAGFIGEPTDVKVIATLDGVAGVKPLIARYSGFLRQYSDTCIYGLIRTDVLRQTHLWRNDLASANALLFELLLHGIFIEVPEVLYLYSGRGPRNRPSPAQEYKRQHAGKQMPAYVLPFLVLARNQSVDILAAPVNPMAKLLLLAILWLNVAIVNGAKLGYRILYRVTGGRVSDGITRKFERALGGTSHMQYVNNADQDERFFAKGFSLRGKA